jgi:hypothetical protein
MKKLLLSAILYVLVININAQTIFNEDFSYTAGDTIASVSPSKGWLISSGGTTNFITAVSPGLTYPGYSGSGIGNAASLTTTGQDIYKDASTSLTSGNAYATFMLNVSAAQAAGDYVFGMLPNTSTSAFFARFFIRLSSTGFYKVGISKSSVGAFEAATYSNDSFAFNSTYLAVVKYQFNAGTNDDSIKVFMLTSGIPASEPTNATVQNLGAIGAGNTDATSLGRLLLRQGSPSNAPTLRVDGIKFANSWSSTALPVQFKSFIATKNNDAVHLKWTTASENNNKGFELQRSNNGAKYQVVGFIKGAGNSNITKTYSYTDAHGLTGNICYRLKQIDFDGASAYSKVTCVNIETVKTTEVITTPNPFNTSLNIKYNSLNEGSANMQIIDMLGKSHQNTNMSVNKGENTLTLDTEAVPLGIYFIRITNGTEVTTQRIVKR